ncbi:MAG: Smr/MutS family protein [Gemmatimonadales bacterium]
MPRRTKHPQFDASDDLLDARVDDTRDLHGLTAAEVPAAVRSFLELWRRKKPGAILHIITGKGKGSANGPVLRGVVRTLLQGELRTMVARWNLDESEGGYKVQVR